MKNRKKLKIGWVGSGFVGQVAHLNNYASLNDVEISGIAELREDLGKKIRSKYNIKEYYKNHKELIESDNFDGIVAIVRRHHTATIAYDILKSNNNLFTEKPMAQNYLQSKNLVNIAKKNNLKYVIGNMRRHDENVQFALKKFNEYIQNKQLGELLHFRCHCFAGGDYCNIDNFIQTNEPAPNNLILSVAPDWLPKRKHKEFEKFLTYFTHDFNLINLFFRDKYKITNTLIQKNSGCISFDYGNYSGTFNFAYLNQNRWDEGIEIYFSKGRIKIDLPPAFLRNQSAKVEIYSESNKNKYIIPKADWTWSFKNQAIAFCETLRTGIENISSGKDTLRDMLMAEKIWKIFS